LLDRGTLARADRRGAGQGAVADVGGQVVAGRGELAGRLGERGLRVHGGRRAARSRRRSFARRAAAGQSEADRGKGADTDDCQTRGLQDSSNERSSADVPGWPTDTANVAEPGDIFSLTSIGRTEPMCSSDRLTGTAAPRRTPTTRRRTAGCRRTSPRAAATTIDRVYPMAATPMPVPARFGPCDAPSPHASGRGAA